MSHIVVSWSTAYDYIMSYKWNLEEEIKKWLTHKLNVAFDIDEMYRQSGGTGMNISYNLALLWENPILLTSIGKDYIFSDFIKENVNLDFIHISAKKMTSGWYITSDASQNQITAFYPWAMDEADSVIARNVNIPTNYGIVSPNKKEAMLSHIKDMHKAWVEVFFDPGPQLKNFSQEELIIASEMSDYLIVNDNEYTEYKQIIDLNDEAIRKLFSKLVITYWENGAKIIDDTWVTHIPAVRNHHLIDTTWVGDAFRAWLLKGLNSKKSWRISWMIGSLLASFCLWAHGAQNHFIDQKHFKSWFYEEFGEEIEL